MDPLQRLIAIEDIRQLKSRYFRFLDCKDWDGLATIFCDDAIFDARTANSVEPDLETGNDWYHEGGEAIVAFIRNVTTPLVSAHHGHCHEIEILSDSEARGIIAMQDTVWHEAGTSAAPLLLGYGHYEEDYRKVDGQWRIHRSRLTRLNVILGP